MPASSARQPDMRTKILLVLPFLLACTRAVPTEFPSSSAASADARPGRTSDVGIALRGDPPLPGEPTEGWPGLEEEPRQGGHHHAH